MHLPVIQRYGLAGPTLRDDGLRVARLVRVSFLPAQTVSGNTIAGLLYCFTFAVRWCDRHAAAWSLPVPDSRMHRGAHPEDEQLFAADQLPRLRAACRDLSWLLTAGYAVTSALKLVGDRYALSQRQRLGVARCACSDQAALLSCHREVPLSTISQLELWIDGYNVLTSVEAALAGGVILAGRDGCFRDMASMHGSWRKVAETMPAVRLLGQFLSRQGAGHCCWLLDRPVSNSGRLRGLLQQEAASQGWNWTVVLEYNPDRILRDTPQIVVSSDREILADCSRWLNLARQVIECELPRAWVVNFAELPTDGSS